MSRSGTLPLLAFAVLLVLTNAACSSPPVETVPAEEDWIHLFNGSDLEGWTPKIAGYPAGENYGNTFRVEGGVLRADYDQYDAFDDRFGHIFYETPYSHYILRLDYRIRGEHAPGTPVWAQRNSGVMFHAQTPESMGIDQGFPTSLEAQFLSATADGERTTLNLCTPDTDVVIAGERDTRHCINAEADAHEHGQWVSVELVVLGDSVVHHVLEGDTVLTYTQPRLEEGATLPANSGVVRDGDRIQGGYVALQAEGHPVDFRNVRLLDLKGCTDPEAANYRAYYVASDAAACRY